MSREAVAPNCLLYRLPFNAHGYGGEGAYCNATVVHRSTAALQYYNVALQIYSVTMLRCSFRVLQCCLVALHIYSDVLEF